jgi:hypothetical protein
MYPPYISVDLVRVMQSEFNYRELKRQRQNRYIGAEPMTEPSSGRSFVRRFFSRFFGWAQGAQRKTAADPIA